MNNIAYTQDQVSMALQKQGYSSEEANRMAKAIGPVEAQDSNILPNLAEASAFTGASSLIDHNMPKEAGKVLRGLGWAGKMIPGGLAYQGMSMLTGNNYGEKSSLGQVAGDLGGGLVGAGLGEAFGKSLGTAISGRAAGAMLGGAAGPVGSIIGGVLGSWLAPKLFSNADEAYLEPNKGISGGTGTALAAAGLLATPLGRPLRKAIVSPLKDNATYKDLSKLLSDTKDSVAKVLPDRVRNYADAYNKPFVERANIRTAENKKVQGDSWWPSDHWANLGETTTHLSGLNGIAEQLGTDLGGLFNRKTTS